MNSEPGFRILEHSGDVEIVAVGRNFLEALALAVEGLVSQSVVLNTVEESEEYPIRAEGDDEADLTVAFLNEVLFAINGRRWMPRRLKTATQCTRTDCRVLTGALAGEPFDPTRHDMIYDIKAVTYHNFGIRRDGDLVEIRFLCDL